MMTWPFAAAPSPIRLALRHFAGRSGFSVQMATCGACGGLCLTHDGQPSDEGQHICKLKSVDAFLDHAGNLHSAIICDRVYMPIEGEYFCGNA